MTSQWRKVICFETDQTMVDNSIEFEYLRIVGYWGHNLCRTQVCYVAKSLVKWRIWGWHVSQLTPKGKNCQFTLMLATSFNTPPCNELAFSTWYFSSVVGESSKVVGIDCAVSNDVFHAIDSLLFLPSIKKLLRSMNLFLEDEELIVFRSLLSLLCTSRAYISKPRFLLSFSYIFRGNKLSESKF